MTKNRNESLTIINTEDSNRARRQAREGYFRKKYPNIRDMREHIAAGELIDANSDRPRLPNGFLIDSTEREVCGFTFLHEVAIANNKKALLHLISEYHANVLTRCKIFGDTALMWAIASSSVDTALALMDEALFLNRPSDLQEQINLPSFSMHTPLILSIAKGWTHTESEGQCNLPQSVIAQRLLALGVNVNAVDHTKRSALHYAYLHRNQEAISALLAAGADETLKDVDGRLPSEMQVLPKEKVTALLKATVHWFTIESAFFPESKKTAHHAEPSKNVSISLTKGILGALVVLGLLVGGLGILSFLSIPVCTSILAFAMLTAKTAMCAGAGLSVAATLGFFTVSRTERPLMEAPEVNTTLKKT